MWKNGEFSLNFSIMSLSKIQCLSKSQKGPYQIFQFLSFSNKGVKWPIFPLTDHLDSKFSPEGPNASPCFSSANNSEKGKVSKKKKNYGKKWCIFFWILDHYLSSLETSFFFTSKIWEKWAFKNKNKKIMEFP